MGAGRVRGQLDKLQFIGYNRSIQRRAETQVCQNQASAYSGQVKGPKEHIRRSRSFLCGCFGDIWQMSTFTATTATEKTTGFLFETK